MTTTELVAHYDEIERHNDAVLAANPASPRYCYTCQAWLENELVAANHAGHSVH